MPSDSKRGRLPFEPRNNNKKDKKKKDSPETASDLTDTSIKQPKKATPVAAKSKKKSKSTPRNSRRNSNLSAIPDVVSKRMGKRMAVFCGIPSVLGMSSLFIFYWLKIKEVIELPPYVALAVSFGFLGLGVLGLSYGLFSACWDEDRAGTLMGFNEFKVNLGRTKDAWKASKNADG
ncbi:PAM68 family protein [Waterburya agarophytonicola K14]|uniref:PAM68 family protein n=1 Tax=Waterburya agarophytonicola KI4 TaxID=2874699 RepID=A0A964BPX7_9CYAN|nr:PAM68 family protein [Waterburya agarophytonicola]MCC0176177.1 PAM68 family protein [Waterburya agarophytonicola KI4]